MSARRRGCIFLKRCLKENRSALPLLRKHSDAIALTWALSFSTAASTTNPLRARPAPSENQHTLVTTAQIRKPGPVYSFARYTKEASDDCFPRRQHKLFRMLKVTPITVGHHILEKPNTIIPALKIFSTETNVILIYVDILCISYFGLLENSTI